MSEIDTETKDRQVQAMVEAFGLEPHPEGGFYKRVYKHPSGENGRASMSAIYYLLDGDKQSNWHRIDADEMWLYHSGAPLKISMTEDPNSAPIESVLLGLDLATVSEPQRVVPANMWQRAESMGDWTLVTCVVAPEFQFEGFEQMEA